MFRVLTPGGRLGISDVVAEDELSPADRAERGSYVGCIAGALSRSEYLDGLTAAGFTDPEVVFTHEAAPGMHGAIVRAVKPTAGGVVMTGITRRIRAVFADRPRVSVCDSCGSVSVCDTACRAGAARDRAFTRYLTVGCAPLTAAAGSSSSCSRFRTRRSISSRTGRTPGTSHPAGSSRTHSS